MQDANPNQIDDICDSRISGPVLNGVAPRTSARIPSARWMAEGGEAQLQMQDAGELQDVMLAQAGLRHLRMKTDRIVAADLAICRARSRSDFQPAIYVTHAYQGMPATGAHLGPSRECLRRPWMWAAKRGVECRASFATYARPSRASLFRHDGQTASFVAVDLAMCSARSQWISNRRHT
jgi:hypothetical protein